MPREPHKTAHPLCPHKSWSACDLFLKVKWGQCKAVVGDKSPEPCTRWAVGIEGWCWQHYISETERTLRSERIAIAKAKLDAQLDEYIAWVKDHPSVHDRMATVVGASPSRKGPHRVG